MGKSVLEITKAEFRRLSSRRQLVADEITSENMAGNYVLDIGKLVNYLAKRRRGR